MSATTTIVSHKMARLQRQRRQNRKHHHTKPRLDFLPVELQLSILETVSSCEDLMMLVASCRTLRAVYVYHKKKILARVLQGTLGHAFIEACMLQHWRGNIDITEEDERWPEGPYRHIQLRFLHDWYEHSTAGVGDQIRNMKRLLTAEDFEEIMKFSSITVKPLSRLFIEEAAPVHDFANVYVGMDPDTTLTTTTTPLKPQGYDVTATERQRIMRALYRFEICCRLYRPQFEPLGSRGGGGGHRDELVRLPSSCGEVMERDFFAMLDAKEIEELSFVYVGLASELHRAGEKETRWWDPAPGLGARARYGSYASPWRHAGYCSWTTTSPRRLGGLGGWIEGALTAGLGFLGKIRAAGTADEVAELLAEEDPPALVGFMWWTITRLREAYHFSGGGESAWPESWSDEFWE